ncbi:MAG: polyribonucleotide nucleotidyltransferase [Planctomycetota bacterium]|jgi:polyribonucleotide nucleotidyltransferase
MQSSAKRVDLRIAGRDLSLETGRIARQASGSVLLRCQETVLLATVVDSEGRPDLDFFPLTVEYREKFAAAGLIPGNIGRREARITDHEILTSRLIDRTLRSLFPKGFKREVQIQISVMSAEPGADLTSMGIIAACAAVHISPLPAKGPAAGLRILRVDDHWASLSNSEQRGRAELDFVVSTGPEGLVMVEGEAREVPGDLCLEALDQAAAWLAKVHAGIAELRELAETDSQGFSAAPPLPDLPADLRSRLEAALTIPIKQERNQSIAALRAEHLEALEEDDRKLAGKAFDACRSSIVRETVLSGGKRLDGRSPEQIRSIWSETGWLPRAHGSAIFTRGETQALVTCTLGTDQDAQRLDGLAGQRREHFLLHYSFPPYSVGEIRPLRGPGRREIGHGFLARRGLAFLLPEFSEFPYTIRIDSEISESNGSSSMATACGGCLALMDAGVPIKRPVAGIAMGLIADSERSVVLSDILGDEDHLGDMDFKVIGTSKGVTALQMDNKVGGLSSDQIREALDQARRGLDHILGEMAKTAAQPEKKLSAHAPHVYKMAIMPDSISALVGPKGSNIKSISASSGCRVNVNDDGLVLIYAPDESSARRGKQLVGKSVGVVKTGQCYTGKVSGVKDFGAFVRINSITEGLVPNEELAKTLGMGEEVIVCVLGCDDRGRLRLSTRQAEGIDETGVEF